MNRRDFLKVIAASGAAYTVDWERLLWVPEKTIFIPPVPKVILASDITLINLNEILKKAFIYDNKLGYRYLQDNALYKELIKKYPAGNYPAIQNYNGLVLTDLDED